MSGTEGRKPGEGERAAIGGYYPQYRISAHLILTALRHDTLEWIRLADPEGEHVDDFQIATPNRLDAYQIKWSRDGGTFSFTNLTNSVKDKKSLILQLADGWMCLSRKHPNRRIVVHLQTNKVPSTSRSKRKKCGERVSFAEFLNQIWNPVHDGGEVCDKWKGILESLKKETGLSDSQFGQFTRDCELEFGVSLPGTGDNDASRDSIYERDLGKLTEFLIQVVAQPSHTVELSRSELLNGLGWTNRMDYVSRHDFPDPTIPYHEIKTSADQLRAAVQHLESGYIILLGDPGSGKSTLLTKTLISLPHRVIRYYAYVPDSQSPASLRGEAVSFFHDLCHAIDSAGFHTGRSLSDLDGGQLQARFHDQLQLLHADWMAHGRKTIILIDGLDHIPRELRPSESLLKYLPTPNQVPQGILIILGSQTDELQDLPSAVHASIQPPDRSIQIGRLSSESVTSIIQESILPFALTREQRDRVIHLAAGHPLALALLLNRVGGSGSSLELDSFLSSAEPFGERVDGIYHRYWRSIVEGSRDQEIEGLLAKLARLRPAIDLRWVKDWAGHQVVDRLRRSLSHLFRRETQDRWYFFHSSFRQFLLQRTAEVSYGEIDRERDCRIHSEIADLCAATPVSNRWNWEEAYHRHKAGQHERVLEIVSTERLREHFLSFRPIHLIREDIQIAFDSAGVLGNRIALFRCLFAGTEFQIRNNNLSLFSLYQVLFEIGEYELAGIHVREGNALYVDQKAGLEFSLSLFNGGLKEEARRVYDLSEPWELLKIPKGPESGLSGEQIELLDTWAEVSVRFRSLHDVVRIIRETQQRFLFWRLHPEDKSSCDGLQKRMLISAALGLIELKDWVGLGNLVEKLKDYGESAEADRFHLLMRGWRAAKEKGDSESSAAFLDRVFSDFSLLQLDNHQKVVLSEAALRGLGDSVKATQILKSVKPPTVITNPGYQNDFTPYRFRFYYSRMFYALGDQRTPSEIIPDATNEEYYGCVILERAIMEIGRLWAMAWAGKSLNNSLFVHECWRLLRLFYHDLTGRKERDKWDRVVGYRSAFYELLVQCAHVHGRTAVAELASAFETEWFGEGTRMFWPLCLIREITCKLFEYGADVSWCRSCLARIEHANEEETAPSQSVQWREDQARSWARIGELERARSVLREVLRLSVYIGSYKDHQLESWIEWMRMANSVDADGSSERFKLLASGIVGLVDNSEAAVSDPAKLLLEVAFDWSPVRAVRLLDCLSASGAIRYIDGTAALVKKALERSPSVADLCCTYTGNCLIPLSNIADRDLVLKLVKRLTLFHGQGGAVEPIKNLVRAVNVWAISELRVKWLSGISEGMEQACLDPDVVGLQRYEEGSEEGSTWRLKLKDGQEISSQEVALQVCDADNLLSLIHAEASDSYFDWTLTINGLAKTFDADSTYDLAEHLELHRRRSQGLTLLADRLIKLGDIRRAWIVGEKALAASDPNGWLQNWDGGSIQEAFRLLARIDPVQGREMAFQSLVEYLIRHWGNPLSIAEELDRIAPLICDPVPVGEIWSFIEDYLRQMFADVTPLDNSLFEDNNTDPDTASHAMAQLACHFLGHPSHVLSHSAQRTCADLLSKGNVDIQQEIRQIIRDSGDRRVRAFHLLDAVSKQTPERISLFSNEIVTARSDPDQSVRWAAEIISNRLEIPDEQRESREVKCVTRIIPLILPPLVKLSGKIEPTSFDILPDTKDPHELVSPWNEDIDLVARAANQSVDSVLARVVAMMQEISPKSAWNSESERQLRCQMNNADLKYHFARPRCLISRRAILHVVAELADEGLLSNDRLQALERVLRGYDPDLILLRPDIRPKDITQVSRAKYNEYRSNWVHKVSTHVNESFISKVEDQVVIAEKTFLKPPGSHNPSELRQVVQSPVSIKGPSAEGNHMTFFPRLIRELVSSYHDLSTKNGRFPAVVHWAYGYDTPGDEWLAFNPSLARSLCWQPSSKGLFAWKSGNDEVMVESIWWNDGVAETPESGNSEVGEGWLVVGTETAIKQMQEYLGPLRRVGAITRTIVESPKEICTETHYFEKVDLLCANTDERS